MPKNKGNDAKKAEIEHLKKIISNKNKIIKKLKTGIEFKDMQTQTEPIKKSSISELDIIKLKETNKELQEKLNKVNKELQFQLNKTNTELQLKLTKNGKIN